MTIHKIQPGDAILANTKGLYGRIIQFGQKLKWSGHSKWHHAAIVTDIDSNGQVWVFQMARHGEIVKLEDVAPGREIKIIPCPDGVNRADAVAYAKILVGTDYGILTIVSIAINVLTPGSIRFDLRHEGTLICSAAVARCWEHGDWYCPTDPFTITPAEIDQILGKTGWLYGK